MFPNVLAFAADENQWLESFAQAWKIATENGHMDLQSLVKEEGDEEDEFECGKLKTRKICETESENCAWQPSTKKNKHGRIRKHCDLASKAPPKPEKKNKNKNKDKMKNEKRNKKMNKNNKKK